MNLTKEQIKASKTDLMKEILVTEHLIDTYSRIDYERVEALEIKLKEQEHKLLDLMMLENSDFTEVFKETNDLLQEVKDLSTELNLKQEVLSV